MLQITGYAAKKASFGEALVNFTFKNDQTTLSELIASHSSCVNLPHMIPKFIPFGDGRCYLH